MIDREEVELLRALRVARAEAKDLEAERDKLRADAHLGTLLRDTVEADAWDRLVELVKAANEDVDGPLYARLLTIGAMLRHPSARALEEGDDG